MWKELRETGIWIPVRVVPKERPQVTKGGAHYSDRYMSFRSDVINSVKEQGIEASGIDYPVSMELQFKTDGFHLQLRPIFMPVMRPTHVRGDIDNLAGGVLDALQDTNVISDDKWVLEAHTRIWEAGEK